MPVANPFAGVIEACGVAAQGFSPDNALRVCDWYAAMPQLIDAIAGMLNVHGVKVTEEFYMAPAAGDFARSLGAQLRNYTGPCENARAAFESAHKDDLDKIRNPQRNQERWDLSLNRE